MLRILLFFVFLGFALQSAQAVEKRKITPELIKKIFPIGEKLTFHIRWTGVPAGKSVLEIKDIQKVDGHDCFHIVSRTKSNSFVSMFYPVDDTIETFVDCKTLVTRKFVKKLNEGKSKRDKYTLFFPEKGKAVHYSIRDDGTYGIDSESKLAGPTQDSMSAMYYFRMFHKFNVDDKFSINVNADQKSWKLAIEVLKKTKMRLWGVGKFHVYEVKPQISYEGLFIKKGEMRIWIDENWGIPLKMKVDVPIGAISVVLDKAESTSLFIR